MFLKTILSLLLTLKISTGELALHDGYDQDLAEQATAAAILEELTEDPAYYYRINTSLYSEADSLQRQYGKPITASYADDEEELQESLEDVALSFFYEMPMTDKVDLLPSITSFYVDMYSASHGSAPNFGMSAPTPTP
ncbi:unnamed protein product [Ambrosiozyma monospora]|uniref:Unnamed protein product n=1 Tax=Ambrosiozyma monospora TaxID=43982 RepID=A0A9W7DFU8_AMBMO|nr:unnamed protein product [Ambrosiozyma monospora]